MKDKPALFGTLLVIAMLERHAVGQPPAEEGATPSSATVINSDFSQGDFAALGWKAADDWDVYRYPKEIANNPGLLARLAAHKPNGFLTNTLAEAKNPKKLTLSLQYGWGWGDADQGADSISFMLLDARGNGYIFEVHRCKARWAVQWGLVANGTPAKDRTWASEDIDARENVASAVTDRPGGYNPARQRRNRVASGE